MVLQAFLAMGFTVEGLLLAFHLKGNPLEVNVHYLLVLLTFSCVGMVLLEAAFPTTPIFAFGKAYVVFLQGTWFCQTGRVLFLGNPAWTWSPNYMGGTMFLPVAFSLHLVTVAFAMLGLYVLVAYKMGARPIAQRGFEAVERANTSAAAKVALQDVANGGRGDKGPLLR